MQFDKLEVEREYSNIHEVMRSSRYREQITLERADAVSISELSRLVIGSEPQILHFSGHGNEEGLLVFQDPLGHAEESEIPDVAEFFRILSEDRSIDESRKIRCVVLNACYSERQARAIARYVDCVVGMTSAVADETAIIFAEAFYLGISSGKSIRTAFELGKNEVARRGALGADVPRLESRRGVDPSVLFLAQRLEPIPGQKRERARIDFQLLLDKLQRDKATGTHERVEQVTTWAGTVLLLRDLLESYPDEVRNEVGARLEAISQESAIPEDEIENKSDQLGIELEKIIRILSTAAASGAAGAALAGHATTTTTTAATATTTAATTAAVATGAAKVLSKKLIASIVLAAVGVVSAAAVAAFAFTYYVVTVENSGCDPGVAPNPLPDAPLANTLVKIRDVDDNTKSVEFSRLISASIYAERTGTDSTTVYVDAGIFGKHRFLDGAGGIKDVFLDSRSIVGSDPVPLNKDEQRLEIVCQ